MCSIVNYCSLLYGSIQFKLLSHPFNDGDFDDPGGRDDEVPEGTHVAGVRGHG